MQPLVTAIGLFIISLTVLIKSSDYFTYYAEKIGVHFRLPKFIIGVSIVAIGTSLPELVSSIIAVLEGHSEIVGGEIIGSNIANIMLVLGVSAILAKKLKITYELEKVDLPILMGSAFIFGAMALDGSINFVEAILLITGLILYLTYASTIEKTREKTKKTQAKKELKGELPRNHIGIKDFLFLALSSVFIYFGAKFTIDSVVTLSQLLRIGTEIISISAVALGTSLPELTVSIMAAIKGKPEMAVGNVLGSNIFNTFGVIGIAGVFGNLNMPISLIMFGLPVMVMATLLYYFITQDRLITKWEGWLLLLFYAFFVAKLFY